MSDREYPLVVESWLSQLHRQPRILQMAGEHANGMGMVASGSGKPEGRRARGNCSRQMRAAGEKILTFPTPVAGIAGSQEARQTGQVC